MSDPAAISIFLELMVNEALPRLRQGSTDDR